MTFELLEPRSIREAIGLLDRDDPLVRPIGGGTALMLLIKSGFFRPKRLISLRYAGGELSRISLKRDGGVHIGAMTTLSAVERSADIRRSFPVIAQTLYTLANVRVRNVATFGGNLAHADPHMDLPPVLIALDAHVTIAGPENDRTILVEELFKGYLETVLKGNELITDILVPRQTRNRAVYLKCTTRSADDWPALGIATSLDFDGDVVRDARVVLGAASDRAVRLGGVEKMLKGSNVDDRLLRDAGETAAAEVETIFDARGSASYKKQLVKVYVMRALRKALGGAPESGLAR